MDIFGNFSKLLGDRKKRVAKNHQDLEFSYGDIIAKPFSKIENKDPLPYIANLKILIVLIFLIFIGRLFNFQVIDSSSFRELALGNRIHPRILESNRGLITDANGNWLARNKPSFALAVYPSDLPKNKKDRLALYDQLASITGMKSTDIAKTAEKNGLNSLDEVDLVENISHDDALIYEQKVAGMAGIFIADKSIRQYQNIAGLAHILGYTGIVSANDLKKYSNYNSSDRIGKTGLEAVYESYLRGIFGVEQIEVDPKHNITRVLADETNKQPVAGDNLVLNIDLNLQQKTAEALTAGMQSATTATGTPVTGGTAIIMDVKTGGILSMVSLPSYDNNLFATKISDKDYQALLSDSTLPMFNRAIAGEYPPGSISKIILASAGLSVGNITKNTAFVTPPEIKIGDYTFPDWKDHSYETTNVERAIAESNNVFFYSVGGGYGNIRGLGIDNIKKYWQLFGLGDETGIDLPGEANGFLPDPAWKLKATKEPWYIGDTYHVSIGQGDLLVTPLQMLRATAVIASNGKLFEPRLVKKIVDNNGNTVVDFAPRIERENFIPDDVIKTVQEGMRLTITSGSARNLNDLPISVAGKTGTAQFLNNQKTHAWFTCYAPYDNPQIAVIVIVDGGGGGHEIAAPVARDILQYYFTR